MSSQLPTHVYSVLISLAKESLILPNSAVAEVLGQDVIVPCQKKGPAWLLGQVEWQHEDVPIVSFEGMVGQPVPAMERKCRVVVLHAPVRAAAVAIVSQAYPLIVTLNEIAMQPALIENDPAAALIYSRVRVSNRAAIIPDLDALAAAARPYVAD